jgi:hypothetical protein
MRHGLCCCEFVKLTHRLIPEAVRPMVLSIRLLSVALVTLLTLVPVSAQTAPLHFVQSSGGSLGPESDAGGSPPAAIGLLPSSNEIADSLRPDVNLVLAAFNTFAGFDTLADPGSRFVSSYQQAVLNNFDTAVLRVELAITINGIRGHIPSYAQWLRRQTPTGLLTPKAFRSAVDRFSIVAAMPDVFWVSRQPSGGLVMNDYSDWTSVVAPRYWDQQLVFPKLNELLNRFVSADPSLTIEQGRYLDVLSSDPYYANRVLREIVGQSMGLGAVTQVEQTSERLARNYLVDPDLQSRPYFQLLMDTVGVL